MKFWDANAVVPLLVEEPNSSIMQDLFEEDPGMVVWWITRSECVSALARKRRDGDIRLIEQAWARVVLYQLGQSWSEVLPSGSIRARAELLLERHRLKTADAYQLAAALDWRDGETGGAEFVCFDGQLKRAAKTEGFTVLSA